ncbi:MAG: BMP family ABC transporter substrate-binding protein, partial [Actinobacteria bacterium]|nr:BMP family ABC transporter substrate-binding protein [Actinomycetota bacterium]
MRSKRVAVAVAGCAALALLVSACGSKSSGGKNSNSAGSSTSGSTSSGSGSSTATGAALNACMVLDTGGIDDHSFNETSYAGMKAAAAANPNIKISYIPSNSGNDYTPNLNTEVGKKCDPIIAVGGLMASNVKTAATANPNIHFAEVDNPSEASNMYGMQFNTAEGAFLGGILAAGMSKTGVVGTWGGAKIGPVTIYMDGFWEGVQYYNKIEHKTVKVLGWNENNQSGGTFVPGNNPFGDPNDGKSISQSMINQGADVLFPVAGGSGLGAGAAAAASGGKVNVIWVDTDGCESAAQYCQYFISSVTKGLSQAVESYLNQAAKGTYPTGAYIWTLANDGTGLAP